MSRFRLSLNDEPALRLDQLHVGYAGAEPVIRDATLRLDQGDFSFLTGPSGAGKSTLLKTLYLALPPVQGEVCLFGRSTWEMSRKELAGLRRRIGVVFQEFRLLDHLTAFENVALPLRVEGRKLSSYAHEVEDLLRWVGLGDKIDTPPPKLSGGEQQRVAIARALINKPDLLIADEPTGSVDPEMGRKIFRLFMELNKRFNTTVLIATHDIALISEFEKPVLKIDEGQLVPVRGELLA